MSDERPSVRGSFRNWRASDMPLGKRLAVSLRNQMRKVRTLSNCCGHPGEPGC